MEKAIEDLNTALEHENNMLRQYGDAKLEYEINKLVEGPLYWELYTKFREAEAAYTAAKQAVLEAGKIVEDLEAKEEREYFANLKCTFCGELDSVCGGDHSEEMRWLGSQSRY